MWNPRDFVSQDMRGGCAQHHSLPVTYSFSIDFQADIDMTIHGPDIEEANQEIERLRQRDEQNNLEILMLRQQVAQLEAQNAQSARLKR
ncbi:hypothetical protein APHAL10511_001474 [Amanita phalloides]|nr:hypothetical protein APHAL10511_001474 [Amanita phalloides]